MFKKIILISLFSLLYFSFSFAYKELIIQNIDKKPVRIIKVVLDGNHYVISSVAKDWWETLQELTQKVGGDTAVNGVYFCPDDYGYCGGVTHTVSERIYMGNWENRSRFRPDTSIRMVFGFDKTGKPLLVQNNMWSLQDAGLRVKSDTWTFNSLYFGLGNFPVFLYQGEDVIYGYETYLDAKMKTRANKTFICSTKSWDVIYMGVVGWINLIEMPDYLKRNFDCRNALNLDAGESIGMIYSWFVLDQGNRKRIMDAFVVIDKSQYQKLTGITPTYKPAKTPTNDWYILTEEDQQKVKNIYNVLLPFIIKNWSKQRWSFISILRWALTVPKIVEDPQKHAIIKDLLRRMFVIDQL